MKVQAMDSAGQLIEADVADDRYQVFDSYVVANKARLIVPPTGYVGVMDADAAMSFLVSQLAYTESKVFEKFRTPMQNEKFIPQRFDAGEHVETIRYEVFDYVGDTDDASPKANTAKTVDVGFSQTDYGVRDGQVMYEYSQHDLRVTAFLRKPLPEAKMTAAVQTYKRRMNKVGLFGRAEYGLEGLFNNSLVPTATLPYGNWTATTDVNQMLADLNYLLYLTWVGSANNVVANQLVLPSKAYNLAQQRQMPYTNTTVLNFFLANNLAKDQGFDLSVDPGFGLETAGVGGAPRTMAYYRDEDHVVQHIPLPLRFLAPQPEGLMIRVYGEYRYCGTHIRYVNAVAYADGLVAAG
jgi:hypothetical protein